MKKHNLPALLVTGLILATAISGCGSDATGTRPRQMKQKQPVLGAAPAGQMPGQMPGQVAPGAGDARQLIAAVKQTSDTSRGFTATIEAYDSGAEGSSTQTLKIAYKKPNTLKITIMKDSNGNTGVQALWGGGSDIKVKPKFPPMAISLSATDKRVISKNGWSIKDTGVGAILNVLFDPSAQVKLVGDQPVGGKLLTMVDVTSRQSPKGADHELIGIDKALMLPAYRCVYKGTKVLYKMTMKSMNLKPPSSSDFAI